MDNPIPEAVRALIDEARRAANVLQMAAHPRQSPHKQPLLDAAANAEATLTAAQQPDHIVDATKMVAQQQGQAVAHPVAWRVLWTPQFPETVELTSDGERILKVQALDDPPYIEPLYTAPPSAPVGVTAAHVDTLRRVLGLLRDTAALQGREHISLGIAFTDAIDYFSRLAQQQQAVNTVHSLVEEWRCRANNCQDHLFRAGYQACANQLEAALYARPLAKALARQPAAVELIEAATNALDWIAAGPEGKRARDALQRALATQHQEPTT